MSIAQPRFVEIEFTRKFDFWEASRALRAKKAPQVRYGALGAKNTSEVRCRALRAKKALQVRYRALRAKMPSKYAIEPYAQKGPLSTL